MEQMCQPVDNPMPAGAAVYTTPTDDELVAQAVRNFLGVISPRLLYHLSVMVKKRHWRGFGEIHLVWCRGRLDTIYDTEVIKTGELEEEVIAL